MKKHTTRVLTQGKLSSELSPSKDTPALKGIRKDVNPLSHVQSTPAHNVERGGLPAPPPLNWDLSMISNDQSGMENKSGERSTDTSEEISNSKKPKRKIVPIKSRFMQSAANRATPKAATKSAPVTGRSSFYTPATGVKSKLSERAKALEKLNHEDTFGTLPETDEKPCTPKAAPKAKPSSPSVRVRSETPKKHTQSPRLSTKPPKSAPLAKVGSGTPKLGRKVALASQKSNGSTDVTPPVVHNVGTGALQEVTQTQLDVMFHQKLQAMYMYSRLRDCKELMSDDASRQLYQMWKVQENLRSEKAELEKAVCLKMYIAETADMVDVLLPLCKELGTTLPTFERQFRSMAQILDATRHYIDTNQIATLTPENVGELEAALRKTVRLLQAVNRQAGDDKDNLKKYSVDLAQLSQTITTVTSHFATSAYYIKSIYNDVKYQSYLTSVMDSMTTNHSPVF